MNINYDYSTNLRQAVFVALVLATLVFISGCASAPNYYDQQGYVEAGITFYKPPTQCPPADGSTWYYEPTLKHADRIMWVDIKPTLNAAPCYFPAAAPGWTPSNACGRTQDDGVGVVYSTIPRWLRTEVMIHHEECHTQGWLHKPHMPTYIATH